jgi:hypothetical protein
MATSHVSKFSFPPAKVLRFNPKGKAVEAIPNDDLAYIAKQGFSRSIFRTFKSDEELAEFAFGLKFFDWIARTKDVREAADRAFDASVASVGSLRLHRLAALRLGSSSGYTSRFSLARTRLIPNKSRSCGELHALRQMMPLKR